MYLYPFIYPLLYYNWSFKSSVIDLLSIFHSGLQTVGIFRVGSSKKRVRQVCIFEFLLGLQKIISFSPINKSKANFQGSEIAFLCKMLFTHSFSCTEGKTNKQNFVAKNRLCDNQHSGSNMCHLWCQSYLYYICHLMTVNSPPFKEPNSHVQRRTSLIYLRNTVFQHSWS